MSELQRWMQQEDAVEGTSSILSLYLLPSRPSSLSLCILVEMLIFGFFRPFISLRFLRTSFPFPLNGGKMLRRMCSWS